MTSITLQIDDNKAEALRQKAARFGLKTEQLLTASVDDIICRSDDDFDTAAKHILSKNKELYQRLS